MAIIKTFTNPHSMKQAIIWALRIFWQQSAHKAKFTWFQTSFAVWNWSRVHRESKKMQKNMVWGVVFIGKGKIIKIEINDYMR